jgi:hypothetical protein
MKPIFRGTSPGGRLGRRLRCRNQHRVGGVGYAAELITYLSGQDPDERGIVAIMRTMVEKGRFEGIEVGFISSLGEYLARGRISAAGGFDMLWDTQ